MRLCILVLILWSGAAQASDLDLLKAWYTGDFDNVAQVSAQSGHVQVYAAHEPISVPAFPDAFYIEEYRDGDPDKLIRQRIVTMAWDETRGQIRMKQGFLLDGTRWKGSHKDPSILADIVPADVAWLEACDVFWQRIDQTFVAQMDDGACIVGTGDDERWVYYRLMLTDDKYVRVDTSFRTSDGTLHGGHDITEPYIHLKVSN